MRAMSALPPKPELRDAPRPFRDLPIADSFTAANSNPYSITSSARATRIGGTSTAMALAALRLMTSVNFVGCSIGKSAGLAPLRILST